MGTLALDRGLTEETINYLRGLGVVDVHPTSRCDQPTPTRKSYHEGENVEAMFDLLVMEQNHRQRSHKSEAVSILDLLRTQGNPKVRTPRESKGYAIQGPGKDRDAHACCTLRGDPDKAVSRPWSQHGIRSLQLNDVGSYSAAGGRLVQTRRNNGNDAGSIRSEEDPASVNTVASREQPAIHKGGKKLKLLDFFKSKKSSAANNVVMKSDPAGNDHSSVSLGNKDGAVSDPDAQSLAVEGYKNLDKQSRDLEHLLTSARNTSGLITGRSDNTCPDYIKIHQIKHNSTQTAAAKNMAHTNNNNNPAVGNCSRCKQKVDVDKPGGLNRANPGSREHQPMSTNGGNERQANGQQSGNNGDHILKSASQGNAQELARLLEATTCSSLPSRVDARGNSVLHVSAASGRLDCVQLIVTRCPSLLRAENKVKDTPAAVCIQHGQIEVLDWLLDNTDLVRECDVSTAKKPLLHQAAKCGQDGCLRLLLEHIPGIYACTDKSGNTAAHLAAKHGHLTCLQTLVEFGLDVTQPNDEGCSPCFYADFTNQRQCAGYLMVVEACAALADKAIQLHTRLKRCQRDWSGPQSPRSSIGEEMAAHCDDAFDIPPSRAWALVRHQFKKMEKQLYVFRTKPHENGSRTLNSRHASHKIGEDWETHSDICRPATMKSMSFDPGNGSSTLSSEKIKRLYSGLSALRSSLDKQDSIPGKASSERGFKTTSSAHRGRSERSQCKAFSKDMDVVASNDLQGPRTVPKKVPSQPVVTKEAAISQIAKIESGYDQSIYDRVNIQPTKPVTQFDIENSIKAHEAMQMNTFNPTTKHVNNPLYSQFCMETGTDKDDSERPAFGWHGLDYHVKQSTIKSDGNSDKPTPSPKPANIPRKPGNAGRNEVKQLRMVTFGPPDHNQVIKKPSSPMKPALSLPQSKSLLKSGSNISPESHKMHSPVTNEHVQGQPRSQFAHRSYNDRKRVSPAKRSLGGLVGDTADTDPDIDDGRTSQMAFYGGVLDSMYDNIDNDEPACLLSQPHNSYQRKDNLVQRELMHELLDGHGKVTSVARDVSPGKDVIKDESLDTNIDSNNPKQLEITYDKCDSGQIVNQNANNQRTLCDIPLVGDNGNAHNAQRTPLESIRNTHQNTKQTKGQSSRSGYSVSTHNGSRDSSDSNSHYQTISTFTHPGQQTLKRTSRLPTQNNPTGPATMTLKRPGGHMSPPKSRLPVYGKRPTGREQGPEQTRGASIAASNYQVSRNAPVGHEEYRTAGIPSNPLAEQQRPQNHQRSRRLTYDEHYTVL